MSTIRPTKILTKNKFKHSSSCNSPHYPHSTFISASGNFVPVSQKAFNKYVWNE